MNSYQRVMAMIEGQNVDRVPVCPFIMAFAARYSNVLYSKYCTDYKALARAQMKTVENFGYDMVIVDSDAYREAHACGACLEFPEDDLPILKKPAIVDKKKFSFKLPDISGSFRLADKVEGVRELKKFYKNEIPVLGWVEAPFQSAAILMGINDFMMNIIDDPGFVKELLDFTTQLAINFGKSQAEAGADIIGIGDAVASMVSPAVYQEFVLPYTKKLIEELKLTGVKLKYHACGDVTHLLDLIAELKADIVNIDSKVDLALAFQKLETISCVKGNIDPVNVLMKGTPSIISREAGKCLGEAKDKRFILSPGCEVPKETPYENLNALIESAR